MIREMSAHIEAAALAGWTLVTGSERALSDSVWPTQSIHAKRKVRIGYRKTGGTAFCRSRLRPAIFSFAFPFAWRFLLSVA